MVDRACAERHHPRALGIDRERLARGPAEVLSPQLNALLAAHEPHLEATEVGTGIRSGAEVLAQHDAPGDGAVHLQLPRGAPPAQIAVGTVAPARW